MIQLLPLILEDFGYQGFDQTEFDKQNRYDKRVAYFEKLINKEVGVGSFRTVHDVGDGPVLKVARSVDGMKSNRREAQIYNNPKVKPFLNLLPKLIEVDPKYRFVVFEKCEPYSDEYFALFLGLKFPGDFEMYQLQNMFKYKSDVGLFLKLKSTSQLGKFFDIAQFSSPWMGDFIDNLTEDALVWLQLVVKFSLQFKEQIREILKPQNLGFNKEGEPVIIDFGGGFFISEDEKKRKPEWYK